MTVPRRYIRIMAVVIIAALTCCAALKAGWDRADAAVTLLYFQGQHNADGVLLEWATATELNTAYFYLERADEQAGPYQMLQQIGLIASEAPPDGLSGAEYQRLDQDNVSSNREYWYVLVEVESTQGLENRTQPIEVTNLETQPPSTATRTSTPVPTATDTPAMTATDAPTPFATTTDQGPDPLTNPTATRVATRTVATRSTPTPTTGAATGNQATATLMVADGEAAVVSEEKLRQASSSEGYPGPTLDAPAIALQSDPNGYPAQPPTLEIMVTKSYPAPVDLTDGDGTPVPHIGAFSQAANESQADEPATATSSPAMGRLFLWLGFVAALIMFVSAVAGAIYYFNRQRYGKH